MLRDPVLMGRRFVEGSEYGWFAYPSGTEHVEDAQEDPVICRVELEQDDYGGPFWSDAGHIGEDFEYLHRVLGISRELYDDAMARNYGDPYGTRETSDVSERDDFEQQQELIRRLGEEVQPRNPRGPPESGAPDSGLPHSPQQRRRGKRSACPLGRSRRRERPSNASAQHA